MTQIAKDVNILAAYLARRDIPALSREALMEKTGAPKADLLILMGGSIPYGCEVAARAYLDGLAERMMIAGGEGHTTPYLREHIHRRFPEIPVEGRAEADVILDFFSRAYGIRQREILRENRSANCGENAAFSLRVARENGLRRKTVLLMQDASMQRRMDAAFRKEWAGEETEFIGYSAVVPQVYADGKGLAFTEASRVWGMWEMDRFLTLTMGEIPRLRDDENGYGPRGKGYIVHVELPSEVEEAFSRLSPVYGELVRRPWSRE